MPIRWDTLMARRVAQELEHALGGARLRAVRLDRSSRSLTLMFKDRALLWHLHPTRGDLRLHPYVEPTETDHRVRGTLRRVQSPPDERIVRFELSGRSGPVSVVVELMSTQWNALVTEGEGETVRHLLWRPSNDTRRAPGQSYRPPPPTGRLGVRGGVSLDEWLAALEAVPEQERARALVRRFAWTSPLNARALLGAPDQMGSADGLATGYDRWMAMIDGQAEARPVVLELPRGPQPYPLPLPGTASHGVETLLDAFAECAEAHGEGGEASPAAVLGPELLARLDARIDQVARRVSSLQAARAGLENPDALRGLGDLILARYHEIPPGAEVARLTGFDGTPAEVELDPAEPAHENASRYYDRAAKAERAAERLPRLVAEAKADLARLEELMARVREGAADEEDVEEAVGRAPPTRRDGPSTPALPYRIFRSSGGLEIRVGRGARFNDDLTFHHSSPNDAWLHARHTAGAHVILRWQGPGNPPARDLREAATLAALHSKARTSGSVPVDWTLRKYVRKPRRSPPGRVAIEREQTVFVEPDPTVMDRLADGR